MRVDVVAGHHINQRVSVLANATVTVHLYRALPGHTGANFGFGHVRQLIGQTGTHGVRRYVLTGFVTLRVFDVDIAIAALHL